MSADAHAVVTCWRLVPMAVGDIKPRENIAWLNAKDFREWKADLIERLKTKPEWVVPIAVANRRGTFVILDGHHRWRSAKLAGRKVLWVVEVKGRLLDPDFQQRQQLEN